MTPEQLQAALNALMEAGLDGDALAAATKALTDAFSSTAEVTDAEAVDAMDPNMAASFHAAETSTEDKATLLESGRFNARKIKVAVALATAKAVPAKAVSGDDIPLTTKTAEAMFSRLLTKAIPGQGRNADVKANPVAPASADKTGFSAKRNEIAKKEGCNLPTAMLKARKEDPKAYNAWVAAGRPE